MLGDALLTFRRTRRVPASDLLREALNVALVGDQSVLRTPTRPLSPGSRVLETGELRTLQRLLLDEEPLTFIPLSSTTPFQNDSPKRGRLLGSPGHGCVPGGKKL